MLFDIYGMHNLEELYCRASYIFYVNASILYLIESSRKLDVAKNYQIRIGVFFSVTLFIKLLSLDFLLRLELYIVLFILYEDNHYEYE